MLVEFAAASWFIVP